MSNSITIKEQTHGFWKVGTCISAILSIFLFIVYWNTSSPLMANSYRLGAFVLFTLAIFGALELKNSSLIITLKRNEENLIVTYQNKTKTVREEQFDYYSIKEIKSLTEGKRILNSYLQPTSKTLKINFTDSKNELYLFEFGGRPLFFDEQSIKEVTTFLRSQHITIS